MKRFILAVFLIAASTLTAKSQSENYRAFKFDVSFGYGSPQQSADAKGGFIFTVQPHYRVSDALSVGLRAEDAYLGRTVLTTIDDQLYRETNYTLLGSYCLTGEYYLTDGWFRPFIGAGAGAFIQSSFDYDYYTETVVFPSKTRFGVVPEAGFELGHLRMSADYNILPQKSGYLGVKLGVFFGGGSKGDGGGRSYHRRRSYDNWGG